MRESLRRGPTLPPLAGLPGARSLADTFEPLTTSAHLPLLEGLQLSGPQWVPDSHSLGLRLHLS